MKLSVRKFLILIIAFCFLNSYSNAQSLARSVISSGGSYAFNFTAGGLYPNIGEVMTTTLSNAPYILTQGFVQTYLSFPLVLPSQQETESLKLFPNPSSNFISISTMKDEEVSIELFDIQGRLILKKESVELNKNSSYTLPVSELNSGVYFVKISDKESNHQFRFVKL